MRRLIAVMILATACRTSDGKKSAPAGASGTTAAAGGAKAAAAPASAASTPATPTSGDDNALLERADRARIQGDTAAPVWVVEISDFQCPYCKDWHDRTMPQLASEFIGPGVVRLAYVNFPLSIHSQAEPAAEATMCAAAQDKFWQMHDVVFATQQRWAAMADATPLFDSLAVSVNVEPTAWRSCMSSHVMRRLISADRTRGLNAGVSSTPTFFVGDEMIRGAAPIGDFRDAIARARAKASGRAPR